MSLEDLFCYPTGCIF